MNSPRQIARSFWSAIAKPGTRYARSAAVDPSDAPLHAFELESRILYSASPLLLPQDAGDAGEIDFAEVQEDLSSLFNTDSQTIAASQDAWFESLFPPANLFESVAATDVESASLELIFVDTAVNDYESLVEDLMQHNGQRDFQIIMLDSSRDGIAQISDALRQYSDVDAVHLVSHGNAGQVKLGNTWLSGDNLQDYTAEFAVWNQSLKSGADLLIYGCDLANTASGQSLIDELGDRCDCDVAASTDSTGSARYGGDWELEYFAGEIETEIAFSVVAQQDWIGKLAVISVTQTADIVNGNTTSVAALMGGGDGGDGISLREAILAVNAGAGGDTINLSAGTYTLSIAGTGENAAATGDLDILKDVTIVGVDAATTIIDGNDIDRVFQLAGADATFQNLTIQDGDATADGPLEDGGGILANISSTLTLDHVDFSSNHAHGGGAIHTQGTLTGANVSFTGNTSTNTAGAIRNQGDLTLEQVTFSGNESNDGGAIYNTSGATNLSLTNVTFSGNSAISGSGGAIFNAGVASLQSVTVTDNSAANVGGGIYTKNPGGVTNLSNTLVAGNLVGVTPNDLAGAFVSTGDNLVQTPGTATGLVGGDITGVDPNLGALQDNGGFTQTHAIDNLSAAFNTGSVTGAPGEDQRGATRDGSPDIGAFEVKKSSLWLTSADDVVSPSGAPGLDSWMAGEVLSFSDPNLTFEPDGAPSNTTNGTFSSVLNLDDLVQDNDARLSGLHYVQNNITVGSGANDFDLIAGDFLFSTRDSETLQSNNSLSVTEKDLVLFRPDVPGNYSIGTFTMILDGAQIPELSIGLHGLTLVESTTMVGESTISAGTFLLVHADASDVFHYNAVGVGSGTTSGTWTTLIDGSDINIDQYPRGIDLIESTTVIGNTTLAAGSILLSVNFDDPTVGVNGISADRQDIFYLTVSKTEWDQPTTVATATLLFDGSDVYLDTANERVHGITLVSSPTANSPPTAADDSSYTTSEDVTLSVNAFSGLLANDSDPDVDPLSTYVVSGPSSGLLALAPTGLINATNLTGDASADQQPMFSPDGSLIAFKSDRTGFTELYTMNVDGTNVTQLTFDNAIAGSPSWSTDGLKLTYFTNKDGNNEIYSINADGTGESRLTTNAFDDSQSNWSPDGTKIVFRSNRDGNNEIYVMNADGTNQTRLTTDAGIDNNPAWSLDGSQITFTSNRSGNFNIYTMNADGSDLFQVTTNAGHDRAPRFSPDGSRIVFQSDRDGDNELFVINADGTNEIQLTNNIINDAGPTWSPNGTKLAFETTRDGDSEIYVVDLLFDGSFDYVPDAGFTGVDTFTYVANDGTADSNVATVAIAVSATNTEEVLTTNDPLVLNEGAVATITTSFLETTDAEQNPAQLVYTVTGIPSNGTLRLSGTPLVATNTFTQDDIDNNRITYIHSGNEVFTDSFTFDVDDGTGNSTSDTFNITITPVNDNTPVADTESFTILEGGTATEADLDTGTSLLDGDTDIDLPNDTLTLNTTPVVDVSFGALTLYTNGTFSYTHDGSENFTDSFTYEVSDALGNTDTATVTITVTPVNEPPQIDLNGSDGGGLDYLTSFTEGDSPIAVADTDATISDVDHTTHTSLTITLTGVLNGTEERIRFGGKELKATESKTDVVTVGSTDFQVDYNGTDFVVTRDGGGVMDETDLQSLIRSITYENRDDDSLDGIRTFAFVLQDAAGANSSVSTTTINVGSVNDPPTLTTFAAAVETTDEETEVEISLADLKTQGDEADVDGTVDAFVVRSVATGTLKIGTSAATATAWTLGSNNTIDATNHAYWTSDLEAFGTQNAFKVVAKDNNSAESVGNVMAQIGVAPVNDNRPVADTESFTILEGGTATEADLDAGTSLLDGDTDIDLPNDTLTVNTTPVVDASFGTLTLNANGTFSYSHDGSENFTDSFTYQVTDALGNTDTATVTITITPVNDNTPVADTESFTVLEGGTATEADLDAGISLLDGDTDIDLPNDTLTVNTTPVVDASFGTLTLNANGTFSYTHDGSENFTDTFKYETSDAAGNKDIATVTIAITPVNEAPTAFTPTGFKVDENTNTRSGTSLGTFTTADPDAGETFSYAIVGGADATKFSIGGSGSDELLLTDGILDFETKPSYSAIVRVTDSGGITHDETLTVSVNDLNESPTNIAPNSLSVNENTDTSGGYNVGMLTTSDEDSGETFTYTIVGGTDQTKFTIGGVGSDELLLTDGTLDFESQSTYSVIVRVTDSGSNTYDETLTVNVGDLNETPTDIAPNSLSVNENIDTSSGYSVGTLTSTDEDGGETFTYSVVGGTDAANFSIGGTAGDELILTDGTLNFEAKSSYSVIVRVTDSFGNAYDETLLINVNDLNETPTDIAPNSMSISENTDTSSGTSVGTLTTTDPDTGETFSYSIVGGTDAVNFSIGGLSGDELIINDGVLDFESKASHSVIVRVTDSFNNTYDETLTVAVNDLNEAPTAITPASFNVNENIDSSSGYSLGVMNASDEDSPESFSYSIVGGVDAGKFSIGGTGINELILTDGTLDYESQSSYSVIVRVTDSGSNTHDETITVAVNDVNEAASISLLSPLTSLAENTNTASAIKIADIIVTDDALGTYSLALTGADAAKFEIVGANELYLNAGTTLDFESQSVFDVTVTVDDTDISGSPDDTESLTVSILNVNETPTASADVYNIKYSFSTSVGLTAGVLNNDHDPDGDPLTAALSSGPAHGSLTLNSDGSFVYSPDPGFFGTDVFTYQIDDGNALTSLASVELTVDLPGISPPAPPSGGGAPDNEDGDTVDVTTTDSNDESSDDEIAAVEFAPTSGPSRSPTTVTAPAASEHPDTILGQEIIFNSSFDDAIELLILDAESQERALQRVATESNETGSIESQMLPETVPDFMFNTWDEIRQEVDNDNLHRQVVIGSALAVSTSLSIGYVIWLIRGGILLSSVLSSMPAWRMIDPLPVLGLDDNDGDDDDESLESLVTTSNSRHKRGYKPGFDIDCDAPEMAGLTSVASGQGQT